MTRSVHLRSTTTPFLFRSGLRHLYILLCARLVWGQFTSQPRWGQATAVVNNVLFVSGGKTDQFGSYSYTSAPTTNDLFTLDLSSSFDPTSPPWRYISGSQNTSTNQGQELAWHSLAAYNTSQMLLFGGDGGPNSPIVLPSQANSAALLDVSNINTQTSEWIMEQEGWAGEPSRRIHHTTASVGGKVYLVGGEKDDGSSLGYSDHYVFDPSVPSFTKLPSENGPPDIYGHGSVVLSDGRVLVLGGYSQSEGSLVPFTTIWSIDTTQATLTWKLESVDSGSGVPGGRRAFAYTWLEGDKLLIHGGSDAQFQTSLSDGWVLDTKASPMKWSNVSALTQLGARRDHFAVQVGSQVVFGFGYGTNAGAPVALSVFDFDKGSFTSSFSPQSGPSLTTLPVPGGTGGSSPGGPNGSGGSNPTGTGTRPGSSPTGSDPNGGDGNGDGEKHTATIVVASIFSVLAVALAAGFLVVVIIRRRRAREQQFHLIQNDDEQQSPDGASPSAPWELAGIAILPWLRTRRALARGEKTRVADKKEGWTVLGLGRPRQRIDMLANEDASELGVAHRARRFGSGSSRSWYSVHDAPSIHERYASAGSSGSSIVRIFSGSLKNMGAGVRRIVSGGSASTKGRVHGRQWTDVSLPLDPFDAYEDSEGLLLSDKSHHPYEPGGLSDDEGDIALAARPRGGRQESSHVSKYSDPFRDQDQDREKEGVVLFDASARRSLDEAGPSSPSPLQGQREVDPRSSQSTLSHSSAIPQLPPLVTTASKSTQSSSNGPTSSSLLDGSSGGHTTSTSSHQTPASPNSARPRTTSIISGSIVGVPSSPVKRSDSWWTRFKRTTSLRDSLQDQARSASTSRTRMDLDFRDPNPPPGRLGAIKEASGGSSGSPDSPTASKLIGSLGLVGLGQTPRYQGQGQGHEKTPSKGEKGEGRRIYSTSGHEQSTTSLKTSRTADSAKLEKLFGAGRGVDVAQREATGTTTSSIIGDAASLVESEGRSGHEREGTWSSLGAYEPDRTLDIAEANFSLTSPFGDDNEEGIVQSPTEIVAPSFDRLDGVESSIRAIPKAQTQSSASTSLLSTPPPPFPPSLIGSISKGKTPVSPGTVAARVADYERRMSLEIFSSPSASSPSSTSLSLSSSSNNNNNNSNSTPTRTPRSHDYALTQTQGQGQVQSPTPGRRKTRSNVKYGLVTRPELFVANPDGERGSISGVSES
ncbi:uncharacterized protein FOMMEDRAFT_17138 [Fomitiporia mediterranea MF3/22]|uniref:uncharacterized protein n=1 Tax=Fomitiporia mediterranea (strain MF3/22) TaxID=694068 RepID=UPI0004408A59|nr:uncharacterized protein FOMMEDRAFT_17138 [Fomitiporia mediterranea MF3/22]EJD06651.1 hypothetical protein FOMMEDRAFT_17138 [Fomitiporia mediterranea MF3/22]